MELFNQLKDKLNQRPNFTFEENRIFKIFNFVVVIGIIEVIIISINLYSLQNKTPFVVCLVEALIFILLLIMHIRGIIIFSRYAFFMVVLCAQFYGSLFHGEGGGFDFLFLTASLAPIVFFPKRKHYLSLFLIGISSFILVKILYGFVPPQDPLSKMIYPYYWNILISAGILFLCFDMFRSEHIKYERKITEKRKQLQEQSDQIKRLNESLSDKVEERTLHLKAQHEKIMEYAHLHAHKAKAPLATLLGLINLSKHQKVSNAEELNFFIENIEKSTNELKEATGEITQLLNTSLWEEHNLFKELENGRSYNKN
ncbi:MAG: hypothetical protein AAF363_22140 [Bacteroidota bacterium]